MSKDKNSENLLVKLNDPKVKTSDNVKIRVNKETIVIGLNENFKIDTNKKDKNIPEKNTMVYVWDGKDRPTLPVVAYSNGKVVHKQLEVFYCNIDTELVYYQNWEVLI